MNFKPLPSEFSKRGFNHKLVKRVGDIAIYSKGRGESVFWFEVIEVQKFPEREIAGVKIEAKEGFCSSEQFGVKGWAYPHDDREGAEKKFKELTGREK